MPRGRPKILSNYEKVKAKKIRESLSANNISRFDKMSNATLLKTVHVSDDRVFISLDYHDEILDKSSKFISDFKESWRLLIVFWELNEDDSRFESILE